MRNAIRINELHIQILGSGL